MLVALAGDPHREIGDTITGEDAVRLIAAGYAEPVEERATIALSKEKAVKKAKAE
ncbi:hypothetical protein HH800_15645 [Sphingobium yanoikuyae]|uniref:Uncharacterized protein n=1 Tax=Sphingobium yanoikuyae TaxID=13690 RepID=A0A6M4G8B1_SPHYA|nr:hypothetical protein [Sphingobium yanoikuyae]QJR03485.1 hypothetical protein HH800_15645 [Sphingobium yanoikuyae]